MIESTLDRGPGQTGSGRAFPLARLSRTGLRRAAAAAAARPRESGFPVSAEILLGLGLGGFFDGIVLHQILQWHHLVTSAGYLPDTVENLKVNTFWDGIFHASTSVFTAVGLSILWRHSRHSHISWSGKLLPGTFLMGFGIFNLVEGIVDHHVLGLHHVNETVAPEQWISWDLGFLAWGAAMLIGGWLLLQAGRRDARAAARVSRRAQSEPPP